MPKGDRLKLKADPEDGTTPISNLLLEAMAMTKISGLQTRAILHLWRETYGWVGKDGKRKKESKITLTEWARALDSANARLSHALAELEDKCIIKRRTADAWGGYFYSLNTDVYKWNSNCINLSKLAEKVGVANFGTVDQNATIPQIATVDQTENSCEINNSSPKRNATVDQNATQQLTKTQLPTLYKERLKKVKEIYTVWNEQNIIQHKKLTDDIKRAISVAIKDYKEEEVIQAIKNYSEILSGEDYYFKYKWTLRDFLKRGLAKFLDLEVAKNNYKKNNGGFKDGTHQSKPGKIPTTYSKDQWGREPGDPDYGRNPPEG